MTEHFRPISPPLPPDPRDHSQYISPKVKPSRDSVIAESIPSLANAVPQSTTRSRNGSDTRPTLQTKPIQEAVDRAFDQSIDQSPTAQFDPNFIAQVTEAVVKNLVNANIGVAPSQGSVQSAPSDQAAQSPVQSDTSIPTTFTPPPEQHDREPFNGPAGDGYASLRQHERTDWSSVDGGDMSSDDATEARKTAFHARRSSRYASTTVNEPVKKSAHRNSAAYNTSPPMSTASLEDESKTLLEKAWQDLFDGEGKPTSRFSQFLRGIAMHIVNDYEPKSSLVIDPAKLLRFFEETRVEDEIYPWRAILGGSTKCSSISTIYRRLRCQHHLIQTKLQEDPNLPALTPYGFEWLMTCLIQAHPDHGFERLSTAVRDMPISNADNPKERFPKELPRTLLPAQGDLHAEQRLIASMNHDPNIRLRNSGSMPPPPTQSASQPLPEQQRQPYTRAPHSNAFEDDDITLPSQPIERERKPYVAREGTGKIYADPEHNDFVLPARPTRHNSATGSFSQSGTTPPDQRGGRSRLNTGPGTQPPLAYNNGRSVGRRSPPLSSSHARSDVGSYEAPTGMHAHRMSASSIDDRYSARRTAASSVGVSDEEPHGRPIPLRQGRTTSGYDSSYSSNGMPPSLPPLGTSLPRQRQQSNADERRRSMYSAAPGSTGAPEGWPNSSDYQSQPPRQSGYPPQGVLNGGPMNH